MNITDIYLPRYPLPENRAEDLDEYHKRSQEFVRNAVDPVLKEARSLGIPPETVAFHLLTQGVHGLMINKWTPEEILSWITPHFCTN